MPRNLDIRSAQMGDASRLAVLATAVWVHTYATEGITDEIARYVQSELTTEKFSATLVDPASHIVLAERDGGLLGFAHVRFDVNCPANAGPSVELETLYVQEHFTGQGIGSALLRGVQALAHQRSRSALWLTVNAKNTRAMAFYASQGYAKVGTTYFVLGESRHENHVLVGSLA